MITKDMVFIKEQTEFINMLIKKEVITYDDIEDLEEGNEVYIWFLVSPYFKEDVKKMYVPKIELNNEMWVGQFWWGCHWEYTNHWKVFEEDEYEPLLKNV